MILIADDNAEVRRMIRNLVEDIDPDIVECTDGSAAVESYAIHHPDWVLMDINMQPLDGLTAARAIIEKYPDARIVIVSQHQDARTRDTALAIGAYAFVGKQDLMELRELLTPATAVDASK